MAKLIMHKKYKAVKTGEPDLQRLRKVEADKVISTLETRPVCVLCEFLGKDKMVVFKEDSDFLFAHESCLDTHPLVQKTKEGEYLNVK